MKLNLNPLTGMYDLIDLNNSRHLSDFIDELPKNCIFIKGKTGCGGTTLALHSKEKYLILMPFVSSVRNKQAKEAGAFIYNGDYSGFNEGVTKIVATYESINSIIKLINPREWNLLVDEFHILYNNIDLRKDALVAIKNCFKQFKSYCFMSATDPDVQPCLYKVLKVIRFNWITIPTKQPVITVCDSLTNFADFFSTISNIKNYIFANSVSLIEKIINQLKISDYSVFMSDSNKANLKRGKLGEYTQYNFFTSTCFESIDINDSNANVVIVFDENNVNTLYTPNQIKQIVGRFRSGTKSVNFVSLKGNLQKLSESKSEFDKQIKAIDGLQRIADVYGDSFRWIDYKRSFKYLTYLNGKIIPVSEAYKNDCFDRIETYKSYKKCHLIYKHKKSSKNVSLRERVKNIDEYTDYKNYRLIKDCIDKIGLENTLRCKTIKEIKTKLIDDNLLPSEKIRLQLNYKPGQTIPVSKVKSDLKSLGIVGPATRIKEFYDVEFMRTELFRMVTIKN